jgi:RNA polymerase sigma-70 factor, ECF subfamily
MTVEVHVPAGDDRAGATTGTGTPAGNPRTGGSPDDERTWLEPLRAGGGRREEAAGRLYTLLLRAARAEVHRRAHRITGPEADDLAAQAAADATVAVTAKLDRFRGESRFTTWAYSFVIFEVSAKLGRHFWSRPDAAIGVADWDRLPDRFGLTPERAGEWRDLVAAIRRAVERDLTERQRLVFTALVLDDVPMDALAVRLGSNRNAIYKTMFDARRRLRASLVTAGFMEGSE